MVERPVSRSGALPLIVLFLVTVVGTSIFNQPQPVPPINLPMAMLQDPEADTYEWEYEVWAAEEWQALTKCRKIGENNPLTEFLRAERLTKRPSRYGEFLFKCVFKSEDLGDPYYVPSDRNP